MKITKYEQSCFLVETKEARILIDPGYIDFEPELLESDWANLDAILVTHMHKDHIHEDAIVRIQKEYETLVYSTNEVQEQYPNLNILLVENGDSLAVKDATVEVVHAVHGFIPKLRELSIEIENNVGYIIDDGGTRFYHTSDTIGFPNDYSCDVLALPVNNHGLCFGAPDAAMFAKETQASVIIPCHYDNPIFPADMAAVSESFKKAELNLHILDYKESIDLK